MSMSACVLVELNILQETVYQGYIEDDTSVLMMMHHVHVGLCPIRRGYIEHVLLERGVEMDRYSVVEVLCGRKREREGEREGERGGERGRERCDNRDAVLDKIEERMQ